MHPPPSPGQANFTLMTECTPESRCYYSVYSVGVTVVLSIYCMYFVAFTYRRMREDDARYVGVVQLEAGLSVE